MGKRNPNGGLKTASGKDRIIPIHPRIFPLVEARLQQEGDYLFMEKGKKVEKHKYYRYWSKVMEKIEADKTPHEARHTFETLLDNAGGNELETNKKQKESKI